MLSKATLIGNVGAPPKTGETKKGTPWLSFTLACTVGWGENKDTVWHNVSVWGKRAEGLSKVIEKGGRVYVVGDLKPRSYKDKNGNEREQWSVSADQVVLLGGGGNKKDSPQDFGNDDLPF